MLLLTKLKKGAKFLIKNRSQSVVAVFEKYVGEDRVITFSNTEIKFSSHTGEEVDGSLYYPWEIVHAV